MKLIKLFYATAHTKEHVDEYFNKYPQFFEVTGEDFGNVGTRSKYSLKVDLFLESISTLLSPYGWSVKVLSATEDCQQASLRLRWNEWTEILNQKMIPCAVSDLDLISSSHDLLGHLFPIFDRLSQGDTTLFETMNYIFSSRERSDVKDKYIDFCYFEVASLRKDLTIGMFNKGGIESLISIARSLNNTKVDWSSYMERGESIRMLFKDHFENKAFSLKWNKENTKAFSALSEKTDPQEKNI